VLREIGRRLLAAAEEAKAYGLSAAHIGEVAPVVIIGTEAEPRNYRLLFNPRVMTVATEMQTGEEGSVSLPGARVPIDRPAWAEIAFMDETGAPQAIRFEHFAARVALHEIDQMNGVFFLERVSRLKREMALKKAKKRGG
jgi:peptide deformylase